jgi:hypothetical protein
MTRTSKRTRYVTSKSEINWGYNDCIAALKEGYYIDAIKLLSVHGSENPLDYSVFRFNLEFWECPKCGDQTALMIGEEKIDQKWIRQNTYQESYKYAETKPENVSSESNPKKIISGGGIRCPLCQWQPGKEVLWTCVCGHRWNTFSTGGKCPACSFNWQSTACPACGDSSPHSSWYRGVIA